MGASPTFFAHLDLGKGVQIGRIFRISDLICNTLYVHSNKFVSMGRVGI